MTITIPVRWVCMVQRTGYHNGAVCNESDPHDGWDCGMKASILLRDPGEGFVWQATRVPA